MRNDLIENDIIKITSQKTGEEAEIPVHCYVKAVLKKYNGKMPKQLNNDKTNDLIKIICQSAFIRRMTAIPHTKGGVKLNPEPVEKWNLCTLTQPGGLYVRTSLIKDAGVDCNENKWSSKSGGF